MKTTKKIFTAASLICMAAGLLITSSCIKKANVYAPAKPLPSFNGFSSSKDIEPSALIAYWPFNGSITDSISNKAGATAGGTSFAAGVKGQAFQGTLTGYGTCPSSSALAAFQSGTISVWVNTTAPTTGLLDYFTLANTNAFWGNIEMFFDNGSNNTDAHVRIHLSQNGNDNTFAAEVPNCFNGWVNLIFSYDTSGACTLYANGVSVATGTAGSLTGALAFQNVGDVVFGCSQFMTTPAENTAAGGTTQPWAAYLPGRIDQVRVYNKVLTADEASALFNLEHLGR